MYNMDYIFEEKIKKYCKKRKFEYVPILEEKSIIKIYELLINDILDDGNLNDIETLYHAHYYYCINEFYKALLLIKKLLNNDNQEIQYEAQYKYANMYLYGKGVNTNIDKAIEIVEDLFAKYPKKVISFLTICYGSLQKSEYQNYDWQKAFKLYWKGVELGCTDSINNLGTMYLTNPNIKDYKMAFELFEKGKNKNDINCTRNLAVMYYNGWYCEQNHDIAIKYLAVYHDAKNLNLNDMIDLHKKNIQWAPYIHKWYFDSELSFWKIENINKIIIILLFISKNRKQSKCDYINCFVKGIALIVVKNLCMMINKF